MKTYCIAEMKFIDVTALPDASISTEDNQSIGNLALFQEQTAQASYGTLELNQFILDGSKEELTETPDDIAFWSNEKSLSDCTFETNPVLEINFSDPHTSSGLTLYFADDYPAELVITWYDTNGTKIISKTYYPDNLICVCKHQEKNYGKICIEFVRTSFPERYVKLQYILYGQYIAWEDDLIQTAKVQEEIDETSATLSINTADVAIIDENNDFDIGNENGAWKSIQKTQEVTLTEYRNGEIIPAGTFFIDDHSFSGNVAKFSLIDAIGLTDKYTFYDGEIYVNALAGAILEKIFAAAGITKYLISDEVYNTRLTGYLAVQKCRAALQMVCFACGAVADDSRSDTIKIYKPDRYVKSTIGTDRKFYGNTKVQLDEYVSGVAIKCSNYALEDKASDIYKDILPVGKTRISFSAPYLPLSITASAGTIVTAKTNYLDITMESAGECIITGTKYAATDFTYQKNVDLIEAGESENIKNYGTCTLFNAELLEDIAEHLLSYHSLRKKVDMKYLLELEQVGNWANIRDIRGNTATTLIESQSIDLTGGFIATASCRGYSIVVTELYYTGTELYAGGGALL